MSAVFWISIGVTLLLIVGGFIYYETSGTTTTTTKGGDSGGEGGGTKTGICTEKDATKCCGGSDKCKSSETACACTPGQSYNCATNKCEPNCICPNGVAATGSACGDNHGVTKCTSCNKGWYGTSAGCHPITCNKNSGTCPPGYSCCHKVGSPYKCCHSKCGTFDRCHSGNATAAADLTYFS